VLQERIELSTSPLPRECSTTELLQRRGKRPRTAVLLPQWGGGIKRVRRVSQSFAQTGISRFSALSREGDPIAGFRPFRPHHRGRWRKDPGWRGAFRMGRPVNGRCRARAGLACSP
jgi:hypothetical protein